MAIKWIDAETVEVTLPSGGVYRGSPVGPRAWVEFLSACPTPERPYEEKENDLGTMIRIPLADDDPLMDAFWTAVGKHNAFTERVSWLSFFDGHLEVPEGWQIPKGFRLAGIETETDPDDLLMQYVRYHVIRTQADNVELTCAISGGLGIDLEEEDAAASLFPGDGQEQ